MVRSDAGAPRNHACKMRNLRLFNPEREPFSDLLLFDGAVRAEVSDVLGRSQVCRTDPGEVVLAAGVPNAVVYVVLQGTLRVDLALAEEGDAAYLGRGECVGELSVIDGSLTSTSVRAANECDLLALQGADILTLADRSHAVARNLLRILTRRLRGTNALLRVEAKQSEILRVRSLTDALTGLHNRGWLDDTLRRMAVRVDRGDASRCSSQTWTISRRSTTLGGTSSATVCCSRSRRPCALACVRPTSPRATAVRSLPCCCPQYRPWRLR
jgi:CRP-like cAMP-binding protein